MYTLYPPRYLKKSIASTLNFQISSIFFSKLSSVQILKSGSADLKFLLVNITIYVTNFISFIYNFTNLYVSLLIFKHFVQKQFKLALHNVDVNISNTSIAYQTFPKTKTDIHKKYDFYILLLLHYKYIYI